MNQADYSDAALVLLGHGTALDPESAAPVLQHAAELRRRNLFAEVREAFWKQEPQVADVLAGLSQRRVLIVPLFISEGYFSAKVIPQALGFESGGRFSPVRRLETQTLFYCPPVGVHERMTELLLDRAREVVEQFPFPRLPQPKQLTLIIVGHGTSQDQNSRKAIEHQVQAVRARNLYAGVHGVFLEEEPRIPACYELTETGHLVVVPFFISGGLHVRQDIPVLLGEPERIVAQRLQNGQAPWRNPTERKGKLVWYAQSVGTHPLLPELILNQVRITAAAH